MCVSDAYVATPEGTLELLLADVAVLWLDGDRIHLLSVASEERSLAGRIKEICFEEHRIVLEAEGAVRNPPSSREGIRRYRGETA